MSSTHPTSAEDWVFDPKIDYAKLRYRGSQEGWYMAPGVEEISLRPGDDHFSQSGPLVYIIHAAEVGRVKIGYSADVTRRIASMRTDSPVKLALVRTYEGGEFREREMHADYDRFRLHGEWFSDDVLELLPDE